MNAAELWWEQVPAGVNLLNHIAYWLRSGCSIVVDAGRMAWPDALRGYLRQVVTDINNALPFEVIDASGCPQDMAPDAFIFSCIGEEDYFGTQLLRVNHLRRKPACLWVDHIPAEQYEAWIRMTVELMREPSQMMLILDIPERVPVPECEGLEPVGVGHSRFDVYYFSLMQLSGMDVDERLLEYAATLATELSGVEPVNCARLCDVAEQLLQSPEYVANSLGCPAGSRQAVLRAQMRAFMPLVELCRMMVNELLRDQLVQALPFKPDNGSTIDEKEVDRLELTHVIQMHEKKRIRLSNNLYQLLRQLRDTRNHLAHLKMLSNNEINQFLIAMDTLSNWQAYEG